MAIERWRLGSRTVGALGGAITGTAFYYVCAVCWGNIESLSLIGLMATILWSVSFFFSFLFSREEASQRFGLFSIRLAGGMLVASVIVGMTRAGNVELIWWAYHLLLWLSHVIIAVAVATFIRSKMREP